MTFQLQGTFFTTSFLGGGPTVRSRQDWGHNLEKNRKIRFLILGSFSIGIHLKPILFKKILTKSNNIVNLHNSAAILKANMHQNEG